MRMVSARAVDMAALASMIRWEKAAAMPFVFIEVVKLF